MPEPLKNKEQDSMRILIRKGFHTRDVKSAVEWYKKYRDCPKTLLKDCPDYKKEVFLAFSFKGKTIEDFEKEMDVEGFDSGLWGIYNYWLFEKAFEDVIKK